MKKDYIYISDMRFSWEIKSGITKAKIFRFFDLIFYKNVAEGKSLIEGSRTYLSNLKVVLVDIKIKRCYRLAVIRNS